MAGIGFKLRNIFEKDTYLDNLRGLVFSSSIAAGPIFFTIFCLALLSVLARPILTHEELAIFQITIVYIFAFSLVSTGATQLIITRSLSDLIFERQYDRILPAFTGVICLTAGLQTVIGLPVLIFWNIAWNYKLTAFMLFIVVACIWQLMVFLSAVKNYQTVLWAFVSGLGVSLLLAPVMGRMFGLAGFIHGYAVGQVMLMFILLARVVIEFRSPAPPEFRFLEYVKKMPELVIIGLCYNIGIWIDKMIFWFSPMGENVHSILYTYSDYDAATFLAYLTVIPSYTYFLVKIETEFAGHFWSFFHAILSKQPFKEITSNRGKIARVMRESLSGMIKLQGSITAVCLFFTKDLARAFHLTVAGQLIFQKVVVAVFLQTLLLTVKIFMLYFDMRKATQSVVVTFLLSNVILSVASLGLNAHFFGYGYLFACLLALAQAYYLLDRHVKHLEYYTFVSQPIMS